MIHVSEIISYFKLLLNFGAWLFFSFLGRIFPRDKKMVIIMAPENSSFTDNAKYAYLWLEEAEDYRVIYLTYNRGIKELLKKNGVRVEVYPSATALIYLLRASVVVGVATAPFRNLKGHLTVGAKLVQLWHGAGVKKVHLGNKKYDQSKQSFKRKIEWRLERTHPEFDLFYFPSRVIMEERKTWFRYKNAEINGFVRNDVLLGKSFGPKELIYTDRNAIKAIKELNSKKSIIIFYAPTYRKRGKPVFGLQVPFDFQAVNQLLKEQNAFMVIKLHPWMKETVDFSVFDRIVLYNKVMDIYPVMGKFDLLVTDYSSIFSDFALMKKPVIHYFPDQAQAINEQKVSKDMIDKMPGPIFTVFDDFLEHLEAVVKDHNSYSDLYNNAFHEYDNQLSGLKLIKDIQSLADQY